MVGWLEDSRAVLGCRTPMRGKGSAGQTHPALLGAIQLAASLRQVSTTVSGFSDMLSMP
jgi:hypothetical protein